MAWRIKPCEDFCWSSLEDNQNADHSKSTILPRISCYFWLFLVGSSSAATTLVMDSAGSLQLGSVPSVSTSEGLVAVVSSQGTPSVLAVAEPSTEATLTLAGDG